MTSSISSGPKYLGLISSITPTVRTQGSPNAASALCNCRYFECTNAIDELPVRVCARLCAIVHLPFPCLLCYLLNLRLCIFFNIRKAKVVGGAQLLVPFFDRLCTI
jgi:hypothetical protein